MSKFRKVQVVTSVAKGSPAAPVVSHRYMDRDEGGAVLVIRRPETDSKIYIFPKTVINANCFRRNSPTLCFEQFHTHTVYQDIFVSFMLLLLWVKENISV